MNVPQEKRQTLYNIPSLFTGKLVQWDSLKPSKNAVQLKVISDWTEIAISDSYEGKL